MISMATPYFREEGHGELPDADHLRPQCRGAGMTGRDRADAIPG